MSIAKTRASDSDYLLAGQASELERLQVQSRVREPRGRRLLEEIGDSRCARALGEVTGTDVDEAMLSAADRS